MAHFHDYLHRYLDPQIDGAPVDLRPASRRPTAL